MNNLYRYLPYKLSEYIKGYSLSDNITEIRLRAGNYVLFTQQGRSVSTDVLISERDINDAFFIMCKNSQNAFEDEISKGFITLDGGYRVGIGGEYYFSNISEKYLLKKLLSLNIRIPHNDVFFENQYCFFNEEPTGTLIVGPPHSGKSTLIRLYSKMLSEKYRICICDERKELFKDNINCDVLIGVEKPEAISMATRTLNPQFIICDEIGLKEESERIISAVNTGVDFICSAHGKTIEEVMKRPNIKMLVENGVFKRMVLLEYACDKFILKVINNA